MNLVDKVRKTVEKNRLLERGDRVVIAASGGPDSVCLMHVLKELTGEYDLQLLAAHLNHGLRGKESDGDEQFVKALSGTMDVPFESARIDIPALLSEGGLSPEDLCREERYRFLRGVLEKNGCTKIALGHHRNDRVETILMNFIRGSGLDGLKGFSPRRDEVCIRPLFDVTRGEILSYLDARNGAFVTDRSNGEDVYLRNRLRNRLIPQLEKEYNPRLSENMISMSDIIMAETDFLQKTAEDFLARWEDSAGCETMLPLNPLFESHQALRRRVVRAVLLKFSPAEKGIGVRHVEAVLALAEGNQPGGRIDLPFGIRVRREYGRLFFGRSGESNRAGRTALTKASAGFHYSVDVPGEMMLPEAGFSVRIGLMEPRKGCPPGFLAGNPGRIFLDFDKIAFPLAMRSFRRGDRMRPLGMTGSRKISDLFIDEKIPRAERERIPLLTDSDDILWAVGVRVGEKARVTGRTRKILTAEII